MSKKEIKWFYPSNFDEAVKIHLQNNLIIPCAGSTAIMRSKRLNNEGFIDLTKCDLSYINQDKKDSLTIGATTTFNEIIEFIQSKDYKDSSFEKMLYKALIEAASYPLRNRITVGGSLYDLPLWSDLISPLLLTDTKVIYNDDQKMDLYQYIGKRKSFPHIIKEIIINYNDEYKYFSSRFALTSFDYAAFRVAISYTLDNNNNFNYFKSSISGTKGIVFVDNIFDNSFLGINIKDIDKIKDKIEKLNLNFSSDFRFSSEYKEQTAKVLFLDLMGNSQK